MTGVNEQDWPIRDGKLSFATANKDVSVTLSVDDTAAPGRVPTMDKFQLQMERA